MCPNVSEETFNKYPGVKAVVVVHIYDLSAERDKIFELCKSIMLLSSGREYLLAEQSCSSIFSPTDTNLVVKGESSLFQQQKAWYAIYVSPRQEEKVKLNLGSQEKVVELGITVVEKEQAE